MTEHNSENMDVDLIHDGVCPVCGEAFGDGLDDLETGDSIDNVRMCVIDKEDGEALYHLPWEVRGRDSAGDEIPHAVEYPDRR